MILFINDETYFDEPYFEILSELGYIVRSATNVYDAFEIFISEMDRIQLVILDIMMPIPNKLPPDFQISNAKNGLRTGEELLRIFNSIPNGKLVPKIILTNIADEDFHNKYKNSDIIKGCYKKKDITLNRLVEIVRELVIEKNNNKNGYN